MIATVIGQIIAAAVAALIGALIVQFATKLVTKYKPTYGRAYKATFLGNFSFVVIIFTVTLLGGKINELSFFFALAIILAIPSVAALIYTEVIELPENQPLGFGDACMISLIHSFLIFVIIVLISFLS